MATANVSNTLVVPAESKVFPYFDDFNEDKNFHKILFRPGYGLQARELTQLQSILQNQIESFGANIYKEGSIIKDCVFTFDNNYNFVKLSDTYANGSTLTPSALNGLTVTNPASNLQAIVVNYTNGLVSTSPNLNTIYIKYLNTGTYSNGSTQFAFGNNEILSFYSTANVLQGQVYSANVADVSGYGYAFTTTEGIIFKKGYFIYVTPQTTRSEEHTSELQSH